MRCLLQLFYLPSFSSLEEAIACCNGDNEHGGCRRLHPTFTSPALCLDQVHELQHENEEAQKMPLNCRDMIEALPPRERPLFTEDCRGDVSHSLTLLTMELHSWIGDVMVQRDLQKGPHRTLEDE
ncbi:hypothetical protein B0O80DRAFT_424228 [Mortierella sp. GBAus27b]|nr:hypothetical protein B0O80DRAFT_424228 [Mortierella sp. GBAus27b]